jgi:hypothetical protein
VLRILLVPSSWGRNTTREVPEGLDSLIAAVVASPSPFVHSAAVIQYCWCCRSGQQIQSLSYHCPMCFGQHLTACIR